MNFMASIESSMLLALVRQKHFSWADTVDQLEHGIQLRSILEVKLEGAQPTLDGKDDIESSISKAESQIEAWKKEGLQFVSIYDKQYPHQLHLIHQRPPFITFQGRLHEDDRMGIAIVGTRKASNLGLHQAFDLAKALVKQGVTVVSGLAEGIDTAAHKGALKGNGRTVAVIGSGLHKFYPPKNEMLQREISERGAVLSQFLPDMSPTRATFPMRNAVMSGFSAATLVVEASETSGAKMQARLALSHGRPVILLDTLVARYKWAQEYTDLPNVSVISNTREACEIALKLTDRFKTNNLAIIEV